MSSKTTTERWCDRCRKSIDYAQPSFILSIRRLEQPSGSPFDLCVECVKWLGAELHVEGMHHG